MKKSNFKLLQKEDGVSLVEVVASVVILTIILISFASFLPQMGQTNNQNASKQQAVNLAQKELIYWKNELEHANRFKDFLEKPIDTPSYDFISEEDTIQCNIDEDCEDLDSDDIETISIITNSLDSNYKVKILIDVESDLTNGSTNAYPTTIIISNNKNKNISETYGYIFY